MNDDFRPLAVVTGASSGIGLELARVLAENDFDLLVTAEDAELDGAAETLRSVGGWVEAIRADLRTPEGVERVAGAIRTTDRTPSVLALNAGVGVNGPFVQTDLQAHLDVIALNITSTVHLAHLVLPDMVARGEGRVLFTSSVAATAPGPYVSTYNASKSFVQSFAQALRNELKSTGVTVTALMPGPTDTEFFERADMEDTRLGQMDKDDPAEVARDGFEAMMAGKDHVVAGATRNKVQVGASAVTPEPARAALHGKMSKPASGK